jgi:hypothetical protein
MRHEADEVAELLVGQAAGSERDRLQSFITELRAEGCGAIAEPLLSGWAEAAAAAAEGAHRRSWWSRKVGAPMAVWKRRLVTAASAAVLLVGGFAGLAWAADGSAPGNALYGLDRALEHVGIGQGGAAERLQEIRDLIAGGNIPGGLSQAGELVGATPTATPDDASQAVEALQAAAARVASQGSEASSDVHAQVSTLLTYLSENIGQVDGKQVSELARGIADDQTPAASGAPDGVPPVDPGTPPVSVPPADHGTPPADVPPVDPGTPPVSVPHHP